MRVAPAPNTIPVYPARQTIRLLLILGIVWGTGPAHGRAGSGAAGQQVREGVQRFADGDYAGAEQAFAEADVALPDNSRVAYDRACVFAAQGDADKALEFFRKAALARDPEVVANCHYNLGCVMTAKARAAFGAKPEEATPDMRTAGLQPLTAALGHYRDCLKVESGHAGARHNLELLRVWLKHMQDVWARRDREQRRKEMDLMALLQMIEGEQTRLRQSVETAQPESDSPRRRQAVKQAKLGQLELAEEIEPLKEKMKESLQSPAADPQAAAAAPDQEELNKALGTLNGLANRAHSAMLKAVGGLEQQDLGKAAESQLAALDQLDELYRAIAPFQNVLQKATATETGLVSRSQEIAAAAGQEPKPEPPTDLDDLARQQALVSGWSETLSPKAEQELQQLKAAPAGPAGPPAPQSGSAAADPQQQAEKQREGLRQALQKAVELGPKIKDLTQEAAEALRQKDVPTALPKQEEALKLLREIAQSLPPQEPPQDQNQDQKKPPQDQGKPQQPPQSPEDKSEKQKPPPPQQDPSQQQADAAIRKVRQREREHRERQKQLDAQSSGRMEVDRDW